MNRKLEPRLETVFILPGEPYSYLSSKLVREIRPTWRAFERSCAAYRGAETARKRYCSRFCTGDISRISWFSVVSGQFLG